MPYTRNWNQHRIYQEPLDNVAWGVYAESEPFCLFCFVFYFYFLSIVINLNKFNCFLCRYILIWPTAKYLSFFSTGLIAHNRSMHFVGGIENYSSDQRLIFFKIWKQPLYLPETDSFFTDIKYFFPYRLDS